MAINMEKLLDLRFKVHKALRCVDDCVHEITAEIWMPELKNLSKKDKKPKFKKYKIEIEDVSDGTL